MSSKGQESHEEMPWAKDYACPNCGDENIPITENLVDFEKDRDYKIFNYEKRLDWSLGCEVHSWVEAIKCRTCGEWYKYENGYP